MGKTANYNLPFPNPTDKANVPLDIQKLAEAAEAALENKVNSEIGKRLMTNTEGEKLASLKNYDDTELNKKIEEQETKIEELEEQNKQLLKDYKPIPFEGVSNHIEDTGELPILDFGINGGIEQDTREGYNLLEPIMESATSNGVTCTNNGDGTFALNGTPTARTTFRLDQRTGGVDNLKNYDDGDYELSLGVTNSNLRLVLMQNNTWASPLILPVNTKKYHAPITNATDCFIYVDVLEGATFNNVVIEPMIRKYNNDNKPFEQYGQMPSLAFPSEVKGVSGHYDNVVSNKNFFSADKLLAEKNVIMKKITNGVRVASKSTGNTMGFAKFLIADLTNFWNKDITVKANLNVGKGNCKPRFFIAQCDKNGNVLAGTNAFRDTSGSSFTTKFKENTTYHYMCMNLYVSSVATELNEGDYVDYTDIQIVLGDTIEGNYIEHQEQNLPIDLKQNFANNYSTTIEDANIDGNSRVTGATDFDLVLFKVSKGNYNITLKSGKTATWIASSWSTIPTIGTVINTRVVTNSATEFDYEMASDGYLILRYGLSANWNSIEEFLNDLYITSEDVGNNITMYSGKAYKENGKRYRPIEWKKVVLDGVNNKISTKSGTTANNYFYTDVYGDILKGVNSKKANLYSNYGKVETADQLYTKNLYGLAINNLGQIGIAFGLDSGIDTIEKANALLQEKNANGTPLYAIVPLAEPTIEEITDTTLIAQLEALEKAHSYKEVTNINSYKSSDSADLVLSGNALMSNDIRMSKLENAILSIGGNV